MKLSGLHLLLTYRCTYECDHCFVRSSPSAEGVMTLSQIKDAVKQASAIDSVTQIYFEGGEPFLYYPILLAGVRYAKELGFDVGIVTNSYFAETVEDAMIWLKPLAEMGGISLSVSDDVFHSGEDTKETSSQRAYLAAKELGMDVGEICIEEPTTRMEYGDKGEPILGGGVRFRGRAVEKLAMSDLPVKPWYAFDECPDEDWNEIGRLHLDPFGNLYPCQGVVVGNMNDNSLKEIVKTYNPDNHPIIGPLKRGGPAEVVRVFNLNLNDDCHDACHLCFLARRELRDAYPEVLAPKQVYED